MATVKTMGDVGAQTMARRKQTKLASRNVRAARARVTPAVRQKSTGRSAVRNAFKANIRASRAKRVR